MEVTRKSRTLIRVQNYVFIVLFLAIIGLIAWLSTRYNVEIDWTKGGRNTLSEASIKLLERIDGPITVTVFATENELTSPRKHITELVNKYQKTKPDIELDFINPETEPQLTRSMGIQVDGEVVLDYNGRSEHVKIVSEENLTNALQRLLRSGERNFVFVTGHGERSPDGSTNQDLGEFIRHLKEKGFQTNNVNLAEAKQIPENTAVLVIAGPQADFLDAETQLIVDFVDNGGHLLWLHEPGELFGLQPLAEHLGISFAPGIVVDPTIQALGINNPSIALVLGYPSHPITNDFILRTLFPQASGIQFENKNNWKVTAFIETAVNSWSEIGPIQDVISYDEGTETRGPLVLGVALTRPKPGSTANTDPTASDSEEAAPEQRIIVMGDGDFLSNTFLGNVGNQDMGYNIFNWLSHDDTFIAIPSKTAGDVQLELSETNWALIGLFFFVGLPGGLLITGITIWWRRRKR